MRRIVFRVTVMLVSVVFQTAWPNPLCANQSQDLTSLQNQFVELISANRFREAEPVAKQMLAVAERSLQDRPQMFANLLMDVASIYFSRGRQAEAEPHVRRALAIREKFLGDQHLDVAFSMHALALIDRVQGRYAEAESLFTRALAIRKKILGDQHVDVGQSLNGLALVYQDQGRLADAESIFKRALAIFEKQFGNEHLDVAALLNNLANVYQAQGRYAEAEPLSKRSLAIKEKVVGEQHPDTAASLNNLAELYRIQGRYAEAEPLQKRALKINEKAFGEQSPDVANSFNNLALLYDVQGRYAEAEPLFRRALEIREKTLGDRHPNVATSCNNLGMLCRNQGRYAEAEPFYKRALEIYKESLGEQHYLFANCLNNLANLDNDLRRYAEAESLMKRALAIRETTVGERHPDVATSLNNLGRFFQGQTRYVEAEESFKRALTISEKAFGEQHPQSAQSLQGLAELYQIQDRNLEAEAFVDRSISIRDRSGTSPSGRFQSYFLRARISWKLGRKNEALLDLRQALDLAEQARQHSSGADKERAEAFSTFAAAFEQMVLWQLELGDASEALQAIERSRAKSLLDEMNRVGTDLNVGRSAREREAIRDKEAQLKARVAQLEKQWELAAEPDRERLNVALAQARNELYDQYRDERNSSPVYRNLLSIGSGPPRISQLQRTLLANDSLALIYLFGSEGGYVIVLGPRQVRLVSLTVDAAQAEILGTSAGALTASRLREILVGADKTGIVPQLATPPAQANAASQKQLTPRLAALWPLLIPAEEREALTSGKCQRLFVVPDGPLALFPFETLVIQGEDDPEYLLDNGPPILYGPSLSVLHNLSTRSTLPPEAGKPVLTVADPVYGPETTPPSGGLIQLTSRSRYAGIGGRLTRLPYTGEESKAVADAFTKAGLLTGSLEREQATEASVRQNITGRKIVHLACHGVTDQAHGNFFGALALTPGKQATTNTADDGFLTLPEIYELDLKGCELAILSACETNYGPQQQGEGVWALSRGFLVGGARRVVASNWLVDDEAGARLISYFCLALAQDEKQAARADYPTRLQAAKKWTRQQNRWKSPYYWSSFVFVGPQ